MRVLVLGGTGSISSAAVRAVSPEAAPARAREASRELDFSHDLLCDSNAIRRELGFREPTPRVEALALTLHDELARSETAGG